MKCPVCEIELVMTDRQGVEIDYCPKCRGIWLDRGELDKVIDKSMPTERPDNVGARGVKGLFRGDNDHYDDDNYSYSGHSGGRRKKGMLGELFDF